LNHYLKALLFKRFITLLIQQFKYLNHYCLTLKKLNKLVTVLIGSAVIMELYIILSNSVMEPGSQAVCDLHKLKCLPIEPTTNMFK